MKKLLIILIIFLTSGTCFAQFARPAGIVTIPTPTFWRNPADSSTSIYQGTVNLYNTFVQDFDTTKLSGWVNNRKLLLYLQKSDTTLNRYGYIPFYRYQFLRLKADTILNTGTASIWRLSQKRALNNHDSLSRLDERKYQSLIDTLTWGLGLSQTGHVVKTDTASASILSRQRAVNTYEPKITTSTSLTYWAGNKSWITFPTQLPLLNDQWFTSYDYAGNVANLFKISKDNVFTLGPKVGIQSLMMVADAGKVNIADMPNLHSAANDTLQYSFRIGGVEMLKMRVIADGSGGAADTTLILGGKLKWPGSPTVGYYLKVMPNGIIKPQPNSGTYQGTWNAATNTPTLADGTGTSGFWYRTVVKGVWGADSARVGSDIYYSGSVWQVIPNATFSVNTATKTVSGIIKVDSVSMKYNGSGQLYVVKTDYVENATHSGDATGATALTLATVNSNIGVFNGQTVNAKGLTTAATEYNFRPRADHDSLTTLQEKNYSSLDGKPDLTVYQLDNDSTNNSGYFTIYMASIGQGFRLLNDQWLYSYDYAGNLFPLIKVSKDNLVTVPNLQLSELMFVRNSGVTTIADMPVNVDAVTGDYYGFKLNIGGVQALRIAGKWTGTAMDTIKVTAPVFEMTTGAAINKIAMSEDSRGKVKWSDTKYLFSLVANRILYASATNEMSQLPLGTSGQLMQSGGANTPTWTTPTYPNSATSGKVLIGDGTNIVLSTPTFPNASATLGKVIKSDGTNFVASTETYAAPGTAGNIMMSSSGNWTSYTPTDWNTAYTDRLKWDGGGGAWFTASTGRNTLGGTTVGQAMFTLTNPSATTFLQLNADNSVTAKNAADFRTAIGAQVAGSYQAAGNYVNKETGKHLPDNNFTDADSTKLLGIASGATVESTFGTVTSVAALTLGTTGTDLSSSVATGTATPVITLNVPTASAANRGALSAADWSAFNGKQAAGSYLAVSDTSTMLSKYPRAANSQLTGVTHLAGTLKVVGTTDDGSPDSVITVNAGIFRRSATSLFTGSSAKWTTKRKLYGHYIDGSANMDSVILDTYISSAATWNAKLGAAITSLGGLTGATQTFAVGTAGTAPAFSSATTTHTLNIPMAATASVTAGLISKTQYDTFNGKLATNGSAASLTSFPDNWLINSGNDVTSGTLTATNFILSSDKRLKFNIQSFNRDDLDRVSKIDFRKFYTYKDSTELRSGVIADEVLKVAPEFVIVPTDPKEMKTVKYIDLLIAVAAQQAEEIKLLKQQNRQLEKRISKLENKNRWKAKQLAIQ